MYIERKDNPVTSIPTFIAANGEEYSDIMVTVNGKRIAADVKRADTDKGYVDIELPILSKSMKSISREDNNLVIESGTKHPLIENTHTSEVKRLTGEVKVLVRK